MSKRIIYLANLRMPTEKAYGIQIAKMCEAFAAQADMELVIPKRGKPTKETVAGYYGTKNNFKVKVLSSPDFYFPGKLDKVSVLIKNFISAIALSRYALSSRADIVFSRDELPLYFLSFYKKNNLIFEAHRFSSRRHRFYRRFKKAGVKIVVISGGLKDEFVKFGFEADKVLVAHDGVDIEEFNVTESREECRHKFDLSTDKKIIGYVGQLKTMGMEKGINVLIEAMAELKKSHPDVLLVIMGGISEDIAYYKNIAKQWDVNDVIIFTGRKNHSEVPYFLKACDILAMPFPNIPHYANFMSPLKMFEYMASGKPIVATELPVVGEVLNENNSVLVRPDDSHALVAGIDRLLADPDLVQRISQRAFKDVQDYAWNVRARKILSFMK